MANLESLGKYKIERAEDYNIARKEELDLSYYEIIRVRDSKASGNFNAPSHLYKYSEDELGLYLKDHKKCWRNLSKVLDTPIPMDEEEIVVIFPMDKFNEVSKVVRFAKRRGNGKLSENFIQAREKTQFKHGRKVENSRKKTVKNHKSNTMAIEGFFE